VAALSGLSGPSGLFGGEDIPLTVDGLQLWLKADAGTFQDSAQTSLAINDGDVIGAWLDQSGNSNDVTQTTTANKPLLKLAIRNGLPVIRWDGTNDRLISSSFSLSQPHTTFAVLQVFASDVNAAFFTDSFEDVPCFIFQSADGGQFRLFAGSFALTTASNDNWTLHEGEFNGVSSVYYLNGSSVASGNAGTNGYDGFSIGASRGNPNPIIAGVLDGDIAEILIYNSILSATDRQIIETYLNGRYAIF